jgi:hypothetical protein
MRRLLLLLLLVLPPAALLTGCPDSGCEDADGDGVCDEDDA